MKKVLSVLLALILLVGVMSMAGCGSKSAVSTPGDDESSTPTSDSGQGSDSSDAITSTDAGQPSVSDTTSGTKPDNKTNSNSGNTSGGHTHSYGNWTVVKNATCTDTGAKERTCSCGAKETQLINALGHKYTAATCEAPEKCERCGQTRGTALGHSYANGKCTRCGRSAPVIESKKVGFGDTVKISYKSGSYGGDFTVSAGTDYTQTYGTLSYAHQKKLIRVPFSVTNTGSSVAQLRLELGTIYDSNGNTSTLGGNPNISTTMTCAYDCPFFNENFNAGETKTGAIYFPDTGAGTYRFVLTDNETFSYSFEFTVK